VKAGQLWLLEAIREAACRNEGTKRNVLRAEQFWGIVYCLKKNPIEMPNKAMAGTT